MAFTNQLNSFSFILRLFQSSNFFIFFIYSDFSEIFAILCNSLLNVFSWFAFIIPAGSLARNAQWRWTTEKKLRIIRLSVASFSARLRVRCLISLQTNVDSTGGISMTEFQNCLANLLSSSRDPSKTVTVEFCRVSISWMNGLDKSSKSQAWKFAV